MKYVKYLLLLLITLLSVSCIDEKTELKFGSLYVNSTVDGAKIFINDKDTGLLAPKNLSYLKKGEYTISVFRDGYDVLNNNQKIAISDDETTNILFNLRQIQNISDHIEMQFVKGGKTKLHKSLNFTYNSLRTNEVYLSDFYMGKYEVSNLLYCEFLNSVNASSSGNYNGIDCLHTEDSRNYIDYSGGKFETSYGYRGHPVVYITWRGAALFCNWLSERYGFEKCYSESNFYCDIGKNGFRLLTNAEWEYASSGKYKNENNIYPWGNEVPNKTLLNYNNSSLYDIFWKEQGDGFYNLAGNAWEYVNDVYDSVYVSKLNPTAQYGSKMRIIKGGSYKINDIKEFECSHIDENIRDNEKNDVGFRFARTGSNPKLDFTLKKIESIETKNIQTSSFDFDWEDIEFAESYVITLMDLEGTVLDNREVYNTIYTFNDLRTNYNYLIKIRAMNFYNIGDYSDTIEVKTNSTGSLGGDLDQVLGGNN